jgi:hypothetical protein
MHCPYKHCGSEDILKLFVADGARLMGGFYGTEQTLYCKCHACGRYFKQVSFCSPLGSTEKREVMMAEIKAMSTVREFPTNSARAV